MKQYLDTLPSTYTVNLVAHSMGSLTLTRAYANVIRERPLDIYRIQHMVLVAPDMDADVFRHEIAPKLANARTSVTLYASSGDSQSLIVNASAITSA